MKRSTVLWPPVLGGLLGGTFVGVAESLQILGVSFGTRDYSGMIYAILLYGAVGLVSGMVLSLLAVVWTAIVSERPEPARAWTLSFLAVALPLGFIVCRRILEREVLDGAALAPNALLALAAVAAGFGLVFYGIARNALKKTFFAFMVQPLGTGSVYGGVLVFSLMMAVGNMLDNRALDDVVPRPVAPELARRPNILLVVVDSLRADALGAYGALGNATPRLDRLASHSLVYDEAIAGSPATRSSVASILSSAVPCAHGVVGEADVLPEAVDTLPEALQRHGYTTGALVNSIDLTASYNFDQGFDTFRFLRPRYPLRASESSFRLTLYGMVRRAMERLVYRESKVERFYADASQVTDSAIRWLQVHGQERWFLLTHYKDPHEPYFLHPPDGTARGRLGQPEPYPLAVPALTALYEGEVAYWDQHFGRLLDWMVNAEILDNTLIFVTADHGEELGDHGGFWHGGGLYDEQLRVPLIVANPRDRSVPGRHSRDQVRLIDVAPTITDLAGAPGGQGWQGFSLRREYALRQPKDRLAFSQADVDGHQLISVRGNEWKLIRQGPTRNASGEGSQDELFFLRTDPLEEVDLARDRSARWALDRARRDLAALQVGACSQSVDPGSRVEPDGPADCDSLRRLGYSDLAATRCPDR